MNYILIDADNKETVQGFISDEDYAGFVADDSRYAVAAVDDNRLYGVGIFEARKTAEILDVIVADDKKGDLEKSIINKIVLICDQLMCDAVIMDVYDEDGALLYDEILSGEGFAHVSAATIYSFILSDLDGDPILSAVDPDDNIIPLHKAEAQMKRVFSNKLIKNGAYDRFMSEDHDPFMSVVSVENDEIIGCALVDDLKDEYGFELAYLYQKKNAGPANMIEMLASALDKVNDRYTLPDAVGYITAMNDVSDGLVRKMLPKAEIRDHINRYVRM